MIQSTSALVEELTIGVIQTTMDADEAWKKSLLPKISTVEDNRAWHEIRRSMKALADHDTQPKIVLLPELALPRTRLADFERMVCSMNAIAIAGVDYRLDPGNVARNEGLVLVPRNFWMRRPSRYATRVWFGKDAPAPAEGAGLKKYTPPWSFAGDRNVYVFDAGPLGRIGVSICYDFMDVERALLYRGRVHHLIVLAYNRDVKLFESLAVSLSRTIYCNVIVCNTGYFGGSLVVSPFFKAHERIGYAVDGGKLFTAQCVRLPVRGLDEAMHGKNPVSPLGEALGAPKYKSTPPRFTAGF